MSVIVKSMEAPKSCAECFVTRSMTERGVKCPLWSTWISRDCGLREKRHPDCPLRPLPSEHGRLGDLDALVNDCEKYIKTLNPDKDGKEIAKVRWLVGILNEQPTIVPAERSGS